MRRGWCRRKISNEKVNKMDCAKRPFQVLSPIPFEQVEIQDQFWAKRQKVNRETSIHKQHQMLEANHHINNFRIAIGLKEGVFQGQFFLDSDLYKWLQAASYILHVKQDPELDEKVNKIIGLIEKAQWKDGYVNAFFSSSFPQKRFSNWYVFHELYCAGHLIEAGIAHYRATGNSRLLSVAQKFADLLVKLFLDQQREGVPGHEELELALIELYRLTNREKYLKLAKLFIDRRGNISNYKGKALYQVFQMVTILWRLEKIRGKFKKTYSLDDNLKGEAAASTVDMDLTIKNILRLFQEHWSGRYAQLNIPVREASEPVGHAVRAMYLYSAMADLYSETGEAALLRALKRIWKRMILSRMYITGGIGSVRVYEGFGKDFELQNEESYSETCAAIGNLLWNWRMLQITGECKYADLIERVLYNGFLVGQSIDGETYSYDNPLVSQGKEIRSEWFSVACCPPNMARIIASLGSFIYSRTEKGLWVHLYIGSKFSISIEESNDCTLIQRSELPWRENVQLVFKLKSDRKFSLNLRIPHWSTNFVIIINGENHPITARPGTYLRIERLWSNGDVIELKFEMNPRLETSDPRIKANRGRAAIAYGSLIYCFEQWDNDRDICKIIIPENPDLQVIENPNLFGGIYTIQGKDLLGNKFTAIPYYAWCNRGPNKMQIWTPLEIDKKKKN